jgi:hypothetical protein
MSDLSQEERGAIARIAEHLSISEQKQVLDDLDSSTVVLVHADRSLIAFDLPGYERPQYRGQHPFSAEGVVEDADGTAIDVILHADVNGRLLELELVRWGDGPVQGPRWYTLEVR